MNGELEFSDVSNLKTKNYNALDYTVAGKDLYTNQVKALKDIIINNNINFASHQETKITAEVAEDKNCESFAIV